MVRDVLELSKGSTPRSPLPTRRPLRIGCEAPKRLCVWEIRSECRGREVGGF